MRQQRLEYFLILALLSACGEGRVGPTDGEASADLTDETTINLDATRAVALCDAPDGEAEERDYCENTLGGIYAGGVCCPAGCGACGGTGCDDRPGGNTCCVGHVTRRGGSCLDTGAAPCTFSKEPTTCGSQGESGAEPEVPSSTGDRCDVPESEQSSYCEAIGGILGGDACCPAGCGTCGGSGCHARPGGANNCCARRVISRTQSCVDSGEAPCNFAKAPTTCQSDEPSDTETGSETETEPTCDATTDSRSYCEDVIGGIYAGDGVCCASSCGSCGGTGCDRRPGGAQACCANNVRRRASSCGDAGSAPCNVVVGETCSTSDDEPIPSEPLEPTEPTNPSLPGTFTANGRVLISQGNGEGAENDFRIGDKVYAAGLWSEKGLIIVEHVANLNGFRSFDKRRIVYDVNTTDGHASPRAMLSQDGVIVLVNSLHNGNRYFASTITVGDFNARKSFSVENIAPEMGVGHLTYSWGIYQLPTEPGDPIVNFFRADRPWAPHYSVSKDNGKNWSDAVRLIEEPGRERQRPYVYTSHSRNGQGDIVHVFSNRGHPDNYNGRYDQGVYHMELRDGKFYAKGRRVSLPADPLKEMNIVSEADHDGIYDAARREGLLDRYSRWGNTWVRDSVAVNGRGYVLWTEHPKGPGKNEGNIPTQVWWARQRNNGSWDRKYVTTILGSSRRSRAIPGAGIDPSNPNIVYVVGRDGRGVAQIFSYGLSNGAFKVKRQITDLRGGVASLRLFEKVPGAIYAVLDGPQIGPDIWDTQKDGVLIPTDRTTKSIPRGPKTYTR